MLGLTKLFSAGSSDAQDKIDALNRSQAVIEFTLDGVILDANENFLSTLGYRLEEIKGKHHSMFVEPAYKESADYRQFWENLKRGEFQAAQYKRIGKGGKEVWIEASYNPIFGKDGRPYKVVKFATDVTKTKSEYADLRGQVDAIRKAQAVIEFNLDGTIIDANDNFLNTLGYRLDEVKGRHHSMFVEPSFRDSADYRQFWERLNRGEFQAAQYKRIGKGGKEVWIEASYNPIFDLNGKPYKVVKYATDVTRQMNLLSDLKTMIDRNFGEIEGALNSVEGQASSAQTSAHATQSNVQTVAAAAEELAASAKEISDSMLRSKQASESAYQEAESADQAAKRLADVAKAMGGIVDLIRSIAGQINLLALNATIEAARAGDAGKGFAVVANEVKNLANQSANATAQISNEIEGMQTVSNDVVGSLGAIRKAMDSVREFVTVTAGAVEEQSAVTRDMSTNMQSASGSVESVTHGVADISAAVHQVRQAVHRTKDAAQVLAR
jgi:methyl-accepting chemotaxis protein